MLFSGTKTDHLIVPYSHDRKREVIDDSRPQSTTTN